MLIFSLFLIAGAFTGAHSGIRYNGAMLRLLEVLVVNFFIIRMLIALSERLLGNDGANAGIGVRVIGFLIAFAFSRWFVRRAILQNASIKQEEDTYWENN